MHAFGFVMTEKKENVHLILAPYNETDEDFFEEISIYHLKMV